MGLNVEVNSGAGKRKSFCLLNFTGKYQNTDAESVRRMMNELL